MSQSTSYVEARGALVRGPRGVVFGPVDVSVDTAVTIVRGDRGSGRTSMLLCVAGRMRLSEGSLWTLGRNQTSQGRKVRKLTGLAGFSAIDALEDSVRVDDAIQERLSWVSPWYRRVKRPDAQQVAEALEPVFGEVPLPDASTLVRDLSEAQDLLLRVALALIEAPRLVVVDDLDDVKDPTERAEVARALTQLIQHGIAFVVGSADERDEALFDETDRTVVRLTR